MAKILVLEDDADIRQNVEEVLQLAQHQVASASNGKEGIEKIQSGTYDLILSDVMMPVVDGFGVLHILQKDPARKNIPFVFLSSKNSITDLRHAMALGASDYIIKPFESSDLLDTIERTLNNAREQSKQVTVTETKKEEMPVSINNRINGLTSLLEQCDVADYSKKHIVYKEGSTPRFVYFIKKGKIRAFKSHEDGKDLVVGLYGENDFMGYAAVLENTFHPETAEITEDAELVLIPRRDFEELLNTDLVVQKQFLATMARHLIEKEEQVLGMAYNTLRKKVAGALVALGKKYHTQKGDKYQINMGREELASIAGTATESLIRTLTEFKQEQLIDINNGIITIINEDRIQNLIR